MANLNDPIETRLARLERANRVVIGIISTTFLLMCSALLAGFSQSGPSQEPLRVRSLDIHSRPTLPR